MATPFLRALVCITVLAGAGPVMAVLVLGSDIFVNYVEDLRDLAFGSGSKLYSAQKSPADQVLHETLASQAKSKSG